MTMTDIRLMTFDNGDCSVWLNPKYEMSPKFVSDTKLFWDQILFFLDPIRAFFWYQISFETDFNTIKKLEESRKREFAKPKRNSLDDWSGWWHLMTVIMVSGWWWLMTMTGISGWWQVMRMTDIRLMMGNDGDWWVWFHSLGRFQQSQSQSARKEMHLTR